MAKESAEVGKAAEINAEKLKALYAEGYRDAEANYELLLNYLES